MPMQTWTQQQRAIEAQDAYRYGREQLRRFEDWSRAKERAADPLEPETEEDEDEMERARR